MTKAKIILINALVWLISILGWGLHLCCGSDIIFIAGAIQKNKQKESEI